VASTCCMHREAAQVAVAVAVTVAFADAPQNAFALNYLYLSIVY